MQTSMLLEREVCNGSGSGRGSGSGNGMTNTQTKSLIALYLNNKLTILRDLKSFQNFNISDGQNILE